MLKFFRNKNVAKMVLWGLLILILPAFVLWGTGSIGRSKDKGPTYVGLINGKKVSFDDYAQSISSVRCQIILSFFSRQDMLESLLRNKALMGRAAWDRLILLGEVKKNKIKVSDAEVVSFIRSHPIFLRNGQFDGRLYGYILSYNFNLDPRGFEETVRENLAIKKLNDSMIKDVKVTDEEVSDSYRKENAPDQTQKIDEEKFKKEKDEYSKKVLDKKKEALLDNWLKKLESGTTPKIDLSDYEKYYK